MLQQFLDDSKGTDKGKKLGDDIKDMMKKMEETETDLVNKRLNPNLIKRQQELLTRLLESEKAMQEQEEDQKRKAETARQNIERKVPPQFQQYVKDKQKQTELLRTVPPNLNPYYKRQVDIYFKQIK
jgi:predicted transcriptional regulator